LLLFKPENFVKGSKRSFWPKGGANNRHPMFIRNLGLTPLEFERWLKQMSAEHAEQKEAQKAAERFE
jgi:hypothetical protein